jgi:hypothetical protein
LRRRIAGGGGAIGFDRGSSGHKDPLTDAHGTGEAVCGFVGRRAAGAPQWPPPVPAGATVTAARSSAPGQS